MTNYSVQVVPNQMTILFEDSFGLYASAEAALDRALKADTTGVIQFAAGATYNFTGFATSNRSNMTLRIPSSSTLKTTSTGTHGFAKLTGSNIRLDGGGRVNVLNWVNDQIMFEFSDSRNICVLDITFQGGTDNSNTVPDSGGGLISGSNTTNPMTFLRFTNSANKIVRGCTFHPGQGMTQIHTKNGNGLKVETCDFINQDAEGIFTSANVPPEGGTLVIGVGVTEVANPRYFHRGIFIEGDEWGHVMGCRFWALGDLTGAILTGGNSTLADFMIRLVHPSNTSEGGHWRFDGNTAEIVACRKHIQLWGANSCLLTGNLFGYMLQGPQAAGEAVIVITGADGTASGTASGGVDIIGNGMHNNAKKDTDGASIYMDAASQVTVLANSFQVADQNNVIRIKPQNVADQTIHAAANFFQRFSAASATVYPVQIETGTFAGDFAAQANRSHKMTGGMVKNNSTGGVVLTKGLIDTSTGNEPLAGAAVENLTTNLATTP